MQTLASATGGEYRFIERAPSSPQPPVGPGGGAVRPPEDLTAAWRSKALLMAAESLESQGEIAAALAEYEKIIDNYPRTPDQPPAAEARREATRETSTTTSSNASAPAATSKYLKYRC